MLSLFLYVPGLGHRELSFTLAAFFWCEQYSPMDVDDAIQSEALRLLEVTFPRDSVDVLLPIVKFAVVPVVVPIGVPVVVELLVMFSPPFLLFILFGQYIAGSIHASAIAFQN